ncbi:protein of unknown function DUF3622 [Streptomyces phage Coruscant]|uniref:Uncharacterized protein n=1 Tax=Streptomyces phage Coruscant TaxID=2739834 RepID=A0A7G4AWC2_9CAUD|nr:protein of unknown function DUF3622 [Streptomyces phage Coruscant]QMP84312.1 protein of unknown function DUF3622 [Streptomyces phage Coruscant]
MQLPSPEKYIEVSVVRESYIARQGNWMVAGFLPSSSRHEMIQGGFANEAVAEAWMRKYLDTYVSAQYFRTAVQFTAS